MQAAISTVNCVTWVLIDILNKVCKVYESSIFFQRQNIMCSFFDALFQRNFINKQTRLVSALPFHSGNKTGQYKYGEKGRYESFFRGSIEKIRSFRDNFRCFFMYVVASTYQLVKRVKCCYFLTFLINEPNTPTFW